MGKVYTTKAADAVSWYGTHLEPSLALIERAADARSASIIDAGGGESTLVDDLLLRGYKNITVLDISQAAIETRVDLTRSLVRLEGSTASVRQQAGSEQWIASVLSTRETPSSPRSLVRGSVMMLNVVRTPSPRTRFGRPTCSHRLVLRIETPTVSTNLRKERQA